MSQTAAGGHGGGAHNWSGGTGTIPEGGPGTMQMERRSQIVITNDSQFNPANGIRSGTGTFEDPYLISGWYVDQILIANTKAAFELKENYVSDILILDWTGQGGYVHHNYLNKLRTNQNVARTGDPSASVIEINLIGKVTELRHFDGVMRNNTIGRAPLLDLAVLDQAGVPASGAMSAIEVPDGVAFNIAGLNGAGIHDNVIFGGVDMKIHGHHHSGLPGLGSHNHGSADEEQAEDHAEDHQVRYVDFLFYNNTIKDAGFGLRYNDLNHAANDRTAASEQEPDLELPHIHYTRVALVNNVIEGATLRVAVMNSDDERHLPGGTGELIIKGNRILDPSAGDGLVVQDVQDAKVLIEGNLVERGEMQLAAGAGILLGSFRNSSITIVDNTLGDYEYGIRAANFDRITTWAVGRNSAPGSAYPVYWDDSVPNAPEGSDGDAPAEHEHGDQGEAAAPSALRRLKI